MKQIKKTGILLLCVLMILAHAAPAFAETAESGWDSTKTYYYKNGQALTGLQKIGSYYYYFNAKGVVQKNVFKKLTQNKKQYYFYFGKNGRAYKAAYDEFCYTFKTYKINNKTYGFDSNSHRITGIWATAGGRVYYFNNNGVLNTTKTAQLRKLAKYNLKSKTLPANLKKVYGTPKKIRKETNSCNLFDGYDRKYYTDYVWYYTNCEIQFTYNSKTKVYCMSGVYAKAR